MTDREAFEAHYKHLDLETDKDAWGRDKYKHQCIDAMWAGWQAATAAERERCAKVCNLAALSYWGASFPEATGACLSLGKQISDGLQK